MRAERTWSLLDTRPVLLYLQQYDEYIVYWNGFAMTHSQALCMTMERIGIYPTPEMKLVMQRTFEKLYYAGAFETRAWDDRLKGGGMIYDWQKYKMAEHIKKATEGKEPAELVSWFDYSKARSNNE
jgi:hypothetical protein